MAALTEIRDRVQSWLPRVHKQPIPEVAVRREPLIGEATQLWKAIDPLREPEIKRAAYFRFIFGINEPVTAEQIAFYKIMSSYLSPAVPRNRQDFYASLSINPDYNKCWQIDKPQPDFTNSISFQLTIWSPPLPDSADGHRHLAMRIIEAPYYKPTSLLVLSPDLRAAQDGGPLLYYDLTDYDTGSEEMAWRRVYPCWKTTSESNERYARIMLPEDYHSNNDWKRRFVEVNLLRFTEIFTPTNVTPDQFAQWSWQETTKADLEEFNSRFRKTKSQGELEFGSIARD